MRVKSAKRGIFYDYGVIGMRGAVFYSRVLRCNLHLSFLFLSLRAHTAAKQAVQSSFLFHGGVLMIHTVYKYLHLFSDTLNLRGIVLFYHNYFVIYSFLEIDRCAVLIYHMLRS